MDGNKSVDATFTQDEYTLTINITGNGSVAKDPDQATYHYGDEVSLTPSADAGWSFSGWGGDLSGNDNPATITMDGNKIVTATFSESVTDQEISFSNGWNIFSLNVTPANTNMLDIVQPLIDEGALVKVQDEAGASIEYNPATSSWVNNIGTWSNQEGYKIRVNDPVSLTVTGAPITDPVVINLASGWNVISHPSSVSQDAMQILEDLISSEMLIKVQDETGAAIEWQAVTQDWINNIGDFVPGEGYKIRVSAGCDLTIDPSGSGVKGVLKSKTTSMAPSAVYYRPSWEGNGLDHMNIYLSETGDERSGFQPGDEIGIFDGSLCVGSGMIMKSGEQFYSFVASFDDPTTGVIDGFIEGHTFSIKVWRPSTNSEASVEKVDFYPGSNGLFERMGSAAILINTSALVFNNELDIITSLGDIYPNPFSNEATIPFKVGMETPVDISIYDLHGKRIRNLLHSNLQSGNYTIKWNADDESDNRVSSGIYFCRMVAANRTFVKIIVMKF